MNRKKLELKVKELNNEIRKIKRIVNRIKKTEVSFRDAGQNRNLIYADIEMQEILTQKLAIEIVLKGKKK